MPLWDQERQAMATLNVVLTLCGKTPLKPVHSIGPIRNRKEWSYCCQSTVTTDNAAGTVAVADKIRTDYNASIFTLGVGPGVYAQNTELRGVANDPDANFTHFVDTFDDLWCVVPIIVAKIGYIIIIFIGYI